MITGPNAAGGAVAKDGPRFSSSAWAPQLRHRGLDQFRTVGWSLVGIDFGFGARVTAEAYIGSLEGAMEPAGLS